MLAYHEHNEKDAAVLIADKVAGGARIALITDAGTPGISDPGFRVTRECRRRGLTVTPLPGPCAIVALLSASGLPTNALRFVGFLAPKSPPPRPFPAGPQRSLNPTSRGCRASACLSRDCCVVELEGSGNNLEQNR